MTVDAGALQEALARTAKDHGPGLYGLVTEDGTEVFAGSVGVADLQHPRPIEAVDRFRIGSITKVYVSTLVLQLIAEGALSFETTLEQLLPGLVPGGEAITAELLLRMRSGLPDYLGPLLGGDPAAGLPPDLSVLQRYWSPGQLVQVALAAPGRQQPDTRYQYCNTDYILLGMLAEQATGQRVDAQLWQRIFSPAGLGDTTFPAVDPQLRGPHAKGYIRFSADSAYTELTAMSPSEAWTAGGIVATAADVAAFFDALLDGRLLPAGYLARMTEGTERLDQFRSRGLGLVRLDFGTGAVAYGHQGGMPGYTSVAARTESGRAVVLWQNGADMHDPLSSDTPFMQAALAP